MATNVTLNGVTYPIPAEGDSNWGTNLSNYFIAIAASCLQKSGGAFALTAETDFGATYGLKSAYFKSQSANPSGSGIFRLGNAESVSWRNAANNADLALKVNASNLLEFGGAALLYAGAGLIVNADISNTAAIAYSKLALANSIVNADVSSSAAIAYSKLNLAASITNADIANAAAIAYSKLNLSSSIVNADIASGAAIAYSKLNLAASITNADIANAAAIAMSKLAALTTGKALQSNASTGLIEVSSVTTTELGYLSGVTSAIQTQLAARIANTLLSSTGDMIYASGANTPARLGIGGSGQVLKSVGGLPTWATFSGGINYASSNPDAEADTSGWATYADAAGTQPVDGTGGSPSSTFTRSTSSPLRGSASFLWTKSAANRQGEGFSFAFTIDAQDQAKVIQAAFDYKIASGTYVDGDMAVYIYDVTNAQIIQPAGYTIQNAGVSMVQRVTFQTASNSTSYRLIVHTASTSALAYTIQFDNFNVGPQQITNGTPITDWQAYTPTGSWVSNVTYNGMWRRVGGNMEVMARVLCSGAPTNANLSITIPSGYTIDTAKLAEAGTNAGVEPVGQAAALDSGVQIYPGFVAYNNSTSVLVQAMNASGTYTTGATSFGNTTPFTFGNLDSVTVQFKVPIVGWSSNTQMSSDTDTRVVAFTAQATSGSLNDATLTGWTSNIIDSHGAFNSGTGTYTVPVPGYYEVSASIYNNSGTNGSISISILQNGTKMATVFAPIVNASSSDAHANVTKILLCKAGDTITTSGTSSIGADTLVNIAVRNNWSIKRLSGPSQIAASETVAAIATGAPANVTASNPIIWPTISTNTHGAYSSSTGKFTAPVRGFYQVSFHVNCTAGSNTVVYPYVDGVQQGAIGSFPTSLARGGGSTLVYANAGQLIDLRPDQNLSSFTSAAANSFSIIKIGN